jgi:hypothetical protein
VDLKRIGVREEDFNILCHCRIGTPTKPGGTPVTDIKQLQDRDCEYHIDYYDQISPKPEEMQRLFQILQTGIFLQFSEEAQRLALTSNTIVRSNKI